MKKNEEINGKVGMMDLTIRKMKRKDIPAIQDIAKISWNSTYTGIIPSQIQESFLNQAYSVKMLKKQRRNSNFYVALINQELIGFANYSQVYSDDSVHLHAIYLHPEYQGKGIGSALLEIGSDQLAADKISLHVERQNIKAIQFYKRKGFYKISEFDDELEGHTIHTIRMIWNIHE